MNIIIVGCGKVGDALADNLSKEGHDLTVVDTKAENVEKISMKYDILGVTGNGSSYNVLIEAGLENTDLLIAVTDSDEVNLLCCLIAKKRGNCKTIARVRNPVYNQEIGFLKEELGIAMIINPEFTAADEIARILRVPTAIEIDTFAKGRMELLKFRLPEGNVLDGHPIIDITGQFKCNVLVCVVERGEEVIIPDGNFVLKAKDIISFVADKKSSARFFRTIKIKTNQVKDALIVGGGKIAYYLAKQLLFMGVRIKIIEKSMERCEQLNELLPEALIICGDGTDREILIEEGLEYADAFVALTNMDEENIMLSLFARQHSKAKLITKINKFDFSEIVNELDLGSTISPKQLTARYIIKYVRGRQNSMGSNNIESLYKINDNKAEAVEFYIHNDSKVTGIPLMDMKIRSDVLIGGINRNGEIIIPRGRDMLLKGDSVIVVTTDMGIGNIEEIIARN